MENESLTRSAAVALQKLGAAFVNALGPIEEVRRIGFRSTMRRLPHRRPGSTLTLKQQQKRKAKNKNAKNARKRNRK